MRRINYKGIIWKTQSMGFSETHLCMVSRKDMCGLAPHLPHTCSGAAAGAGGGAAEASARRRRGSGKSNASKRDACSLVIRRKACGVYAANARMLP